MAAELTADGGLHRFVRSEAQIAELKRMSATWREGPQAFWSFDDVLLAVSRPASAAFFAANAPDAKWHGVIFADVGPFTADLLYVYVETTHRRSGVARRLVERLLSELTARPQIESLFLEVRESNAGAQSLYESLGMQRMGRRRAYYQNGEDALVYRYALERGGAP